MWYGGQECPGMVEQHSWAEDKVTVWLLDQKLQICCKAEEVWLAELQGPIPQAPPPEPGTQAPAYRPVSRNIDVPKRFVWENLGSERHVGGEVWGCEMPGEGGGMWKSQISSGQGLRQMETVGGQSLKKTQKGIYLFFPDGFVWLEAVFPPYALNENQFLVFHDERAKKWLRSGVSKRALNGPDSK